MRLDSKSLGITVSSLLLLCVCVCVCVPLSSKTTNFSLLFTSKLGRFGRFLVHIILISWYCCLGNRPGLHEPPNLTQISQRGAFFPVSVAVWCLVSDSEGPLRPDTRPSQAETVQRDSELPGWFAVVCGSVDQSPLLTDVGALQRLSPWSVRPPRRRSSAGCFIVIERFPEQAFLLCFFFFAPLCSMINNRSGPKTSFSTTGRIHFILSVNVCRCIVLHSSVELLSTSGFLSAARLPLKEMIHCSGK